MIIYNSLKLFYIRKICIPVNDWLRYHEFIDDKDYEKRILLLMNELKTIKFYNSFR